MISLILHGLLWWAGFYVMRGVPPLLRGSLSSKRPSVCVIIPARNEEKRLSPLLQSLAAQTYKADQVIVVDDHSTDATAALAREFGFDVLASAPLPPTWLGKTWACWQGAQKSQSDVLLFLDADIVLAPDALAVLLNSFVARRGVQSVLPYHAPGSWTEELSAPFNLIQLMSSADRLFGPVLMISRRDYFLIGGHEAVKNDVVENFSLAAVVKKFGLPLWRFIGVGVVSYRMYPEGFGSLLAGWTKSFSRGAAGTSIPALAAIVLWLTGAFGTFRHLLTALIAADMGRVSLVAAIYAVYGVQIFFFLRRVGRFHWSTSFFYPVSFLFFVFVMARSLLLSRFKRPAQWKGRPVS